MGILDVFSPEGFMRAMGVQPAELLAEYNRVKAELANTTARLQRMEIALAAMPDGVKAATDYFAARCDRIEGKLAEIVALLALEAQRGKPGLETRLNGNTNLTTLDYRSDNRPGNRE